MEYPRDLKEQTEGNIVNLEKRIAGIRKRIEEAISILSDHEQTIENKKEDYRKYEEMLDDNPLAAHAFAEKKKLDISIQRRDKKKAEIDYLQEQLENTENSLKKLRSEIKKVINFNPVEKQANNPETRANFYTPTFEEWGKMPNSRFKTFQEAFTSHHRFRIFPREMADYSGVKPDNIPLRHCVVDPDRFTDKFLTEFDLVDFPEDLTRFEKLRIKAEAIPAVTNLFEHLKPILKKTPAGSKPNYRFFVLQGYNPDHDGKIVHTHYTGNLPKDYDHKVVQPYDNAYDACRGAGHIDTGYEGETQEIMIIRNMADKICDCIKNIRAEDPDKEEKKDEARKSLDILMGMLGKRPAAFHKKNAKEILDKICSLKDSLNRDNPTATYKRLEVFTREINKRFPQIFNISGYQYQDRQFLSRVISRCESDISLHSEAFRQTCGKLASVENSPVFKKAPKGQADDEVERAKNMLLRQMKGAPDLRKFKIRPFNLYGQKLEEKKRLVAEAVKARDIKKSQDEAVKAFVICKIFQIQKEIESIIERISPLKEKNLKKARNLSKPDINWETMRDKTKFIHTLANEREVFSDIEIQSYKGVYTELSAQIRELHSLIEQVCADANDENINKVIEHMEKIDFPSLLSKLN